MTHHKAVGKPPFASRFATGNQGQALSALGFVPGAGGADDFTIGWVNGGPGGGHTSGRIGDVNVEMGGARGNGQIGGQAASPESFPNIMHLPLPSSGKKVDDQPDTAASSDSFDSSDSFFGGRVDWGSAASLHEQAQKYVKLARTRGYASGGRHGGYRLPTSGPGTGVTDGFLGVDAAGVPVARLDAGEWIINGESSRRYGRELAAINAGVFPKLPGFAVGGMLGAQQQLIARGLQFTSGLARDTELVIDAEAGLAATHKEVAADASKLIAAEEELAVAQRELAKAEADGGGLKVATRRKLEDAERALAKARAAGKPDRIADAELRLARSREDADRELAGSEDKRAETVRRALAKVNKAEDKVAKTREEAASAADKIAAAERTVLAARIQATADAITGVFDVLSSTANRLSELFQSVAEAADNVERLRQENTQLAQQQVINHFNLMQQQRELSSAQYQQTRAQMNLAIVAAQGENRIAEARRLAGEQGELVINTLGASFGEFGSVGFMTLRALTAEEIDNSDIVRDAKLDSLLAQLDAQDAYDQSVSATNLRALELAEIEGQLAFQTQVMAANTAAIKEQAAQIYGMTRNEARGASRGFGGVGKMLGGFGKFIGGAAAALAGFAVGGPVGALAGAGLAINGIADIAKGSVDVHHNKAEMGKAWKGMGAGEKATVILGGVGALGAGAAGGILGGAAGAALGAKLGDGILDATIGTMQYNMTEKLRKSQERHEDTRNRIEAAKAARDVELSARKLDQQRRMAERAAERGAIRDALLDAKAGVAAMSEEEKQAFFDRAKMSMEEYSKIGATIANGNQIAEKQLAQLQEITKGIREANKAGGVDLGDINVRIQGFDQPQLVDAIVTQLKNILQPQPTANQYADSRL